MFLPKKKGDVFFPARKAADERWGVVRGARPIHTTKNANTIQSIQPQTSQ
jgi:hypothetical protein